MQNKLRKCIHVFWGLSLAAIFFLLFTSNALLAEESLSEENPSYSAKSSPLDEVLARLEESKQSSSSVSEIDSRQEIADQYYRIFIHEMIELDFKKKAEVFDIRSSLVNQYPRMRDAFYVAGPKRAGSVWSSILGRFGAAAEESPIQYQPSEAVFGQIIGGKPWWGIIGTFYSGGGKNSIAGPSEETRFLCNPYLLVGLKEQYAYQIDSGASMRQVVYPQPLELRINPKRKHMTVRYDLSSFLQFAAAYGLREAAERLFSIIAYNARDFGYGYFSIDFDRSKNIKPVKGKGRATKIHQFIHLGKSCGRKEWCNNMSPRQRSLEVLIPRLPAVLEAKLWRNSPGSVTQAADVRVTLEMS